MSSKIGTTSKIETHGCIKIIIINFVYLGEARWGRSPPRVKDPNFILGQTYVSSDESSQKCQKACEAYGETPEIHKRNFLLSIAYPVVGPTFRYKRCIGRRRSDEVVIMKKVDV